MGAMPSQPAPAPSGPAFAVRAEVADAAARSLSYFQGTYAGTLFLAVRLAPDAASQLEAGLSSSAAHARSDAALDVIGFETNEVSLSDVRQIAAHMRRERHDAVREAALLRKRVSECPHYAVPLVKRDEKSAVFGSRISIGRARNVDVVLRHPSVSKLHAWFEHLDDGTLVIADAGTTNGTRLRGRRLAARTLLPAQHGDVLRFGAVEALLCNSDTVWQLLRRLGR